MSVLMRVFAVVLGCVLAVTGCTSQQQVLTDQQKALISLTATGRALAEAWLAGTASTTYTLTALEASLELLEKQRASLTASPATLADPRAAAVRDAEEALARRLAVLWKAVHEADASTVRTQASALAAGRPHHP